MQKCKKISAVITNFTNIFTPHIFSLKTYTRVKSQITPTIKIFNISKTHPALIRAFSARFLGLYSLVKASCAVIRGLFVRVGSIAPSNEILCADPGDVVPFALKE